MKRIGIIGFGNMGEAFAAGLKEVFPALELAVVEKVPLRSSLAKDRYQAKDYTGDWGRFFDFADLVILAVKPQDAASLTKEIGPYAQDKKFISIIAGKPLGFFKEFLQTPFLARFMPNLAAMYRKAAVGISFPEAIEKSEPVGPGGEFREQCLKIAEAIGHPILIPERLMPMITGLSGSGIAFVFQFIHAMALGGVKTGFSYPAALETALQVVEGAVELLKKSQEAPSTWITRVASPAGTTIAGLQVLEEEAVTAAIIRAVEAAGERAEELEGA